MIIVVSGLVRSISLCLCLYMLISSSSSLDQLLFVCSNRAWTPLATAWYPDLSRTISNKLWSRIAVLFTLYGVCFQLLEQHFVV